MKFKTGLVSLLVVCGACSQATKEADVVKDSFDFAGQQLKYAFTQIDSAKASMPEEQLKRKPVSPRTIEDNGALCMFCPKRASTFDRWTVGRNKERFCRRGRFFRSALLAGSSCQ